MRDKDVLEDRIEVEPIGGVGGQIVPPVDDTEKLDDQFPEEERDAGDEMIAPDDDRLLEAGGSPEFDHSLRRRKGESGAS